MKSIVLAGTALVTCLTALRLAYGDDDLQQCAAIEDDASRLACYDRNFSRQTVPAAADKAPAPRAEVPESVAEPRKPVADSSPSQHSAPPAQTAGPVEEPRQPVADSSPSQQTAPTGMPAPATAPVASGGAAKADSVASETETFGLPPDLARPGSGDITARVSEITRRPLGQHVIVLDNGQVWEQQTKSSYFPVKPSDSVTIRKRRFSGYLLITPSGRGYSVKRVQ